MPGIRRNYPRTHPQTSISPPSDDKDGRTRRLVRLLKRDELRTTIPYLISDPIDQTILNVAYALLDTNRRLITVMDANTDLLIRRNVDVPLQHLDSITHIASRPTFTPSGPAFTTSHSEFPPLPSPPHLSPPEPITIKKPKLNKRKTVYNKKPQKHPVVIDLSDDAIPLGVERRNEPEVLTMTDLTGDTTVERVIPIPFDPSTIVRPVRDPDHYGHFDAPSLSSSPNLSPPVLPSSKSMSPPRPTTPVSV